MSWALSSPVGSSPDDDFHLVSIWCASPAGSEFCLPGTDSESRVVPPSLVEASCYAFKPEVSAGCQDPLDFEADPSKLTTRGNFVGAYPPYYYATMGVLASHDIVASVIAMRALNAFLFAALATVLYLLLPARRRPALVWSWVLTTVPLGLFILASNNPSSWTIMGVGFGWIALLGYLEADDYWERRGRKIALGAVFVLCALMAAGSRGDGAVYTILGILAVGILTFARTRRFLLDAILPVGVAIVCVFLYRFSRPVESVTGGVTSDSAGLLGTMFNKLLEVPSLWAGVLGREWGLGWLDTSMPAVVWLAGLACFIGVGFVAMRGVPARRLVVLLGGVLVLALLPAFVLTAAGDNVGDNMQPRYLLPIVVLFTGLAMLPSAHRPARLTRAQWILVATTLSVTQLISLHINMQRYISGTGDLGLDLNAGIQWWWQIPLSPMVVWIAGSAAFSGLLFITLEGLWRAQAAESEDLPVPAPRVA